MLLQTYGLFQLLLLELRIGCRPTTWRPHHARPKCSNAVWKHFCLTVSAATDNICAIGLFVGCITNACWHLGENFDGTLAPSRQILMVRMYRSRQSLLVNFRHIRVGPHWGTEYSSDATAVMEPGSCQWKKFLKQILKCRYKMVQPRGH